MVYASVDHGKEETHTQTDESLRKGLFTVGGRSLEDQQEMARGACLWLLNQKGQELEAVTIILKHVCGRELPSKSHGLS